MHIINDIPEFIQRIQRPDGQIYGLVPTNYSVTNLGPIKTIFDVENNLMVYGDVIESFGNIYYVRCNPSFSVDFIVQNIVLNSPIFVKTAVPLMSTATSLQDLTIDTMKQIFCKHIPEPIFKCNHLLDETNTQS